MKNWVILFIAILITCATISFAQPPHLWAKTTGTDCQSDAVAIAVDLSGNVLEYGTFKNQISNFDTLLIESPYYSGILERNDVYLFKYNSSGQFLWALKSENSYREDAKGIATDANGNIYITGFYLGDTLKFGSLISIPSGHLKRKAFLVKISPAGVPQWMRTYFVPDPNNIPLNYGIEFHDVIVNSNHEIIVYGYIQRDSTMIGGFKVKNYGINDADNDLFVAKFDMSGNVVWVKQAIGINSYENIEQLTVDSQNNIYIVGHTIGANLTIDNIALPETNLNSPNEAFIFKLDNNGNAVWGDRFGTTNGDKPVQAQGVAVDDGGNIYVAGEFRGLTLKFGNFTLANNNTQMLSSGSRDLFIAKYNNQGNKQWVRGISHSLNYDYAESIYRLQKGVDNWIYATGSFYGQSITWDNITVSNSIPTLVSQGYNRVDPFIVKFDKDGTALWIKTLHDTIYYHNKDDEYIWRIVLDNQNNVYGCGRMLTPNQGLLIDTSLYLPDLQGPQSCSPNTREAFILKIQGTIDTNQVITSLSTLAADDFKINIYPNPSSDYFVIQSNKPMNNATVYLFDVYGKIVLNKENINGYNAYISTQSIPTGFYFYQLQQNSKIISGKIHVKK
ncbi:MAG: SBBP repeat-containing protein [candidate division WOR-3 bacterium]